MQLLVSPAQVELYLNTKNDLDAFRGYVEKSELWVYRSTKDGAAEKEQDGSSLIHTTPSRDVLSIGPSLLSFTSGARDSVCMSFYSGIDCTFKYLSSPFP